MTGQLLDVPQTAESRPKPICGGKRFKEFPSRKQRRLEAWSVDELVPVRITGAMEYDLIGEEIG